MHRFGVRAASYLGLLVAAGGALMAGCGDDGADATPTSTATSVPAAAPQERAAAMCAAMPGTNPRAVQAPEAVETSGIAASRMHEGVIWAHNDSGDVARAIAFSDDGIARGVYTIEGAEALDWEDMAIGPGPDPAASGYLYLGDIGDNNRARTEIIVYRVPEPDVGAAAGGGSIAEVHRIVLTYPDAPHDAETLLVDPITGDLVIVTKELATGNAGIYRAQATMLDAGGGVMERAGEIPKARLTPAIAAPEEAPILVRGVGYLPTGGDISPDGALIAIRTYGAVWIWPRASGTTIAEALASPPCEAPSALETQGEAIAFEPEGVGYMTIGEGPNPLINRFATE